jgi:predicted HD phosphohydrolase
MIRTILHETKHVEQFINQPLYYRIATKVKNFLEKHNLYNDIFYLLAFHEIAARRYARKTMKKYYKQLNKIIKDAYENKLEEILV